MSKQVRESAAQTLFNRLVRTWIVPAANARAKRSPGTGPIPLRLALLVWEQTDGPTVFLNDEVFGNGIKLEVIATGPVSKGQQLTAEHIGGLGQVSLGNRLNRHPYIFVVQGCEQKFYIKSSRIEEVLRTRDFNALAEPLSREGVLLTSDTTLLSVYLDVIRNFYDQASSVQKRKEMLMMMDNYNRNDRSEARRRARRHLRLPTLIIHKEDEFLPLVLETRATYIDGHFFSCIASAVTTADRICIRLTQRYSLPSQEQNKMLAKTLGQKLQPLRAKNVVTEHQEELLNKMNRIRNRHLHPRRSPSSLVTKRDALAAVRLLHEFLEGTFSVFRDYMIENGRLMPKPLE